MLEKGESITMEHGASGITLLHHLEIQVADLALIREAIQP
jgi:hypothetical protein